MKPIALLLCLLAFSQATTPRNWDFPRDHGRHDGFKTEWWYFTANLTDSSGRKFGCQLTFFRSAISPQTTTRPSPWGMNDFYFAHAAISDLDAGKFYFKDRLSRGRPGLAYASDSTLDVSLLDWSARLEKNAIHLEENENEFSMDLVCSGGRGPILEGPGGINRKGRQADQASYYYSMTRMRTIGTLAIAGKTYSVSGQTWMDHEFSSNALAPDQMGWDWMGLNLADGHDLMIYRLRSSSAGGDYISGTVVNPDGTVRYLSGDDVSLSGSDLWRSPVSGGDYPQSWTVHCAGLPPLIVRSRMAGQELNTSNPTHVDYFEGSAEVLDKDGKVVGQGYLEMTGYAAPLGGV